MSDAQRDIDAKRLAYLQALNLELNTQVRLDGELIPKPVDIDLTRATVWAMELRPELKSQVYKAKTDAIGVNLALSRRLPTVLFGGTYEALNDSFPLEKKNWEFGVSIRLPFSYNFWTQLRQKRAEQRQGQLKRASLEDDVRLDVRTAFDEVEYWQAELPKRREAFEGVRDLFTKAETRRGVRGLGARISVLDAELAYIEALQDSLSARAALERAV
jgi:outer membrane protein TolC